MLSLLAGLVAAAAPISNFTLTPNLAKGELSVVARYEANPRTHFCIDMPNAGSATRDVELQQEAKWVAVPRDEEDADCFVLPVKAETLTLRYRVDLRSLTGRWGDPDFASNLGANWVFHDQAVLLHPVNLPDDAKLTVKFVLGKDERVATPWEQTADGTFFFDAKQHDGGAYVALGRLRTLEEVVLPQGRARITLFDEPKDVSDEQLRAWLRGVLETLVTFYGSWPSSGTRALHVVMAGMNDDSAGVFGSVRRRGDSSVMLLYGAHAKSGWDRDWVALHELFHLGNPPTSERFPWFSEGFTTYFSELLRGRRGVMNESEVWGNLAGSIRAHCQPEDGASLSQTSQGMSKNAQWMKVYWGGACLALRLDVAIREKSKGAKTLDAVMRTLRASKTDLSEKEVVDALDQAAGSKLASTHLAEHKAIPVEALLTKLGVGAVKDEKATLVDTAPLAALRKSLTKKGD